VCMYKKIILFFIIFLGITCVASKQEEMFLTANNLYKNKEYKKALDLYKKIEKPGPVTYYNMGNCEYNMGNYVSAIVAWSRAKKGSSWSKRQDINYNIIIAHDKLGSSYEVTFWQEIKEFVCSYSLFFWQVLFLLFWFLFFAFLMFLKKEQNLRMLWLFLALSGGFIFAGTLLIKYQSIQYKIAIVIQAGSLFAGPNEKYHQIGNLSVADEVIVQKSDKNWYKIDRNGVVGWVNANQVEVI